MYESDCVQGVMMIKLNQLWADEMNGKVPSGTFRAALEAQGFVDKNKRIAELESRLASKDAELAEDKRQLTNLRGLLNACEQELALYNSQINELEAQLTAAQTRQTEAEVQAARDARRADKNAAELTSAQAGIARKQALLKRLEWSETGWEDPDYCAVCNVDRPEGHRIDCALAAELKE